LRLKNKEYKTAEFLLKYNTIIFDMDGVITSEECYWDTAAMTVWEMYCGEPPAGEADKIRAELFYNDRLIKLFKERGVNSNWDLAYLVYAFLHSCKSGKGIYEAYSGTGLSAFELYEHGAQVLMECQNKTHEQVCRLSPLWIELKDTFQEWYLGSEEYYNVYGQKAKRERQGLYGTEKPLFPAEDLKILFSTLKDGGKRLCIGTGRPASEIYAPLLHWGLYDYFDPNGVINYDDVERAEKKLGIKGLTKPNPFMFLKAYFGREYPDRKIIDGDFGKVEDCLVVGDAGADLMAAHAMGADFAAVLTGVSGESGRPYFENERAEYILKDVTGLVV
jgi:phosphoglycolate phosphatase-like HAD superfamily hydrolase